MLSLGPSQRYFLYSGVADMRKGFDGLSGLVLDAMEGDPLSGDVFVFVNRGRNRIGEAEIISLGSKWICVVVQATGERDIRTSAGK